MQIEAWRAMGEDRRTELAIQLSEDVRLITLDGLRARNPGVDEESLKLLLVRLWHGPEVADRIRR